MLHVTVAPAQRLLVGPIGPLSKAQWVIRSNGQRKLLGVRWLADAPKSTASDKDSILSSDPAFLPGSQRHKASERLRNTVATPATPSSVSSIPLENVPKPPPPPPATIQTSPPTTTSSISSKPTSPPQPPPPPSPPAQKPKPRRRGLRFLLYLITAGGLAYGGGVLYALRNDNFHDFFTEYIPFGEDAVLYFEEQDFRRRFPHASAGAVKVPQTRKEESNKVTIPSKSGLSWKVSDEEERSDSDTSKRGRHMSALDVNKRKQVPTENAQQAPEQESPVSKSGAVEKAKSDAVQKGKTSADGPRKEQLSGTGYGSKSESPRSASKAEAPASQPSKPDERRAAIPAVTQISPLSIEHAEEPVVQELVKIINDIITVINSDSADATNKYSAPLAKAKESLSDVGSKILALKQTAKESAAEEITNAHKEFDDGARELLKRIDAAREQDAVQFRQEFEAEREKLSQSYAEKVKNELERYRELINQQQKNEMVEQAIQLKRNFVSEIQELVEQERNGRLSRLSELSENVGELQRLTSDWSGVIDTNLATQKLQVAVEAVRSTLSSNATSNGRPKPFVRELAALKEVANGDPIVDAAIASINPTAYQHGLPSSSALIIRFRGVASEVRKASLLPENAGFASHLASAMLSKVMFKKQGMAEGNDVESILTRTETLLEEGDLDGAAREMNTLQGWAKVLSKDWLRDVRKVLEVRQALEVIETEARLQCLRVE